MLPKGVTLQQAAPASSKQRRFYAFVAETHHGAGDQAENEEGHELEQQLPIMVVGSGGLARDDGGTLSPSRHALDS